MLCMEVQTLASAVKGLQLGKSLTLSPWRAATSQIITELDRLV